MEFSTTPNFGTGAFYGPTDAAAGPYPADVYLPLNQFQAWQLHRQLALNQDASTQYTAVAKGFPMATANPYAAYITALEAQIAQLPAGL